MNERLVGEPKIEIASDEDNNVEGIMLGKFLELLYSVGNALDMFGG